MTGHLEDAERSTTILRRGLVPAAPHILIAEHQPVIQELLCQILQLAGYRTTVCADRHAALTWREQAPPGDDPALILLDLSLLCAPEAADFLCRLRARWLDAGDVLPQVIVLTTSTQVQAELGTREHVLQKPFHVRDLITLIQQATPVAYRSENGSSREIVTAEKEGALFERVLLHPFDDEAGYRAFGTKLFDPSRSRSRDGIQLVCCTLALGTQPYRFWKPNGSFGCSGGCTAYSGRTV